MLPRIVAAMSVAGLSLLLMPAPAAAPRRQPSSRAASRA